MRYWYSRVSCVKGRNGTVALRLLLTVAVLLIFGVGCEPAVPPAATATLTRRSEPSPTPMPTPIQTAVPAATHVSICNTAGIGAYVRAEPRGQGITAWPDSTLLEIVGADRSVDGEVWRNVRDQKGSNGWIKADYLCVIMPSPGANSTLVTSATQSLPRATATPLPPSVSRTSVPSSGTQWKCTEFDPPYRVLPIEGTANVYSGVDQPNPSGVKGKVTGGAGGIEASCTGAGQGTYYRLRGVNWWGWVQVE